MAVVWQRSIEPCNVITSKNIVWDHDKVGTNYPRDAYPTDNVGIVDVRASRARRRERTAGLSCRSIEYEDKTRNRTVWLISRSPKRSQALDK